MKSLHPMIPSILKVTVPVKKSHFMSVSELEIWTESLGDPSHPTILLIAGAGSPSTFWYDGFFYGLAQAGFHVIRYDHRDCGYSTHLQAGLTHYTLEALNRDAFKVLEAYGVLKAHIVGHSMGCKLFTDSLLNTPRIPRV